jgi:hypothetical protein
VLGLRASGILSRIVHFPRAEGRNKKIFLQAFVQDI